MNPFTLADAPAWLAEDPAKGSKGPKQPGQIPRLLERLLELAEYVPQLYDVLPWLRKMSVWELLVERRSEALVPDAPPCAQEAILTTFFARVTQPVAEMIEALYLSALFRSRHTVWEIMRHMARSAGVKALPADVVTGVCAGIVCERFDVLRDGIQPQTATWEITWRPTSVRLRWSEPTATNETDEATGINQSLLILVTERVSRAGRVGEEEGEGDRDGGWDGWKTRRVLAFRCTPDLPHLNESGENLEAAVKLALYDALVFASPTGGQSIWSLSPPTVLRVQSPVPKAIKRAARMWRIKLEEIVSAQPQPQPAPQWSWEAELTQRIVDPVHYLRILDRVFERAYGYAPFQAKQRAVRQLGWHMLSHNDPLLNCPGLHELLPSFPATVGDDGTVEWQGWHYRDYDQDVLRYFSQASVTIRPSPLAEAGIVVYWHDTVLCYAVADELRHEDGSLRPYWFPFPRLGE